MEAGLEHMLQCVIESKLRHDSIAGAADDDFADFGIPLDVGIPLRAGLRQRMGLPPEPEKLRDQKDANPPTIR